MLDICLLGCGGMMPLPERHLSAAYLMHAGKGLLIDCGEGTQTAMRENALSFKKIETILITHFHADHISGLPGLLLSIGNSERTQPLLLAGPKGLRKVVESLLIIAPEIPFPLAFHEFEQTGEELHVPGFHITAIALEHRVKCFGYTIEVPRSGKFQPEKAAENAVPQSLWSTLQKGNTITQNGITYTPDMVLGKQRKGLKCTYATDSRPLPSIGEAAKDADLLICEGIYGEEEKREKAKEKKHMIFSEAAHLAAGANCKRLWLTHYSPALVNPEEHLEAATSIFENAEAGFDGKRITLKFEND